MAYNFYEDDGGNLEINKISYENEKDIEKAKKYLHILTHEMNLDIYIPNLDYLTVRSLINGNERGLGVRILKLRDWYYHTLLDDNRKHYIHLREILKLFVYPKKYNFGKFIKELEHIRDMQENQYYQSNEKNGLSKKEEFGFNIIYYTHVKGG